MAMHMHGFEMKLGSITQNCICKRNEKNKQNKNPQTKNPQSSNLEYLSKINSNTNGNSIRDVNQLPQ